MIEVFAAVSWMIFLPCWVMLIGGVMRLRRMGPRPMENDPDLFIIQITTKGNAPESVSRIIREVEGFGLGFPFQLWVVAEEGDEHPYPAHRVLRVPRGYMTPNETKFKARALCYAREVRLGEGVEDRRTKVLLLDDDSVPTRGYVEYAYHCDFDVAQGIIAPRRDYGRNLLASIADNARTADCLAFCSFFNSRGDARIVHGEGLLFRGHVEAEVGWDFGECLAEDLIFGRKATRRFRFGLIPDFVEISPPRSVRDFFIQRRRWFWGHISALRHLDLSERAFVVGRYVAAFLGAVSYYFVVYDQVVRLDFSALFRAVFLVNSMGWMSYYAISSYINLRSWVEALKAAALAFPAAYLESGALLFSLLTRPKGFEVIEK